MKLIVPWTLLSWDRLIETTLKSAYEQVAEVVPGSVVVDLVDIEVALEQRCHKHKRRNKAPATGRARSRRRATALAPRSFGLVRARRASSQNAQQQ